MLSTPFIFEILLENSDSSLLMLASPMPPFAVIPCKRFRARLSWSILLIALLVSAVIENSIPLITVSAIFYRLLSSFVIFVSKQLNAFHNPFIPLALFVLFGAFPLRSGDVVWLFVVFGWLPCLTKRSQYRRNSYDCIVYISALEPIVCVPVFLTQLICFLISLVSEHVPIPKLVIGHSVHHVDWADLFERIQ